MASDWDMLAGKVDAVEPEEEQEDTIWRVGWREELAGLIWMVWRCVCRIVFCTCF
jgi:hypothetical protein